jgi:uncharacterized lipoprotein YmbA
MRRFLPLAAGLALLAAAGCVSFGKSTPARFFVLDAVAERAAGGPGPSLGLLPLEVPSAVRRPELLVTRTPNRVEVKSFDRWAEPVEAGVARTLADNLARLVPSDRVETFPWMPGSPVERRVRVRVTVFELAPDVPAARLAARWSVLGAEDGEPLREGSWSGEIPAGSAAPEDLVKAMSEALAGLAAELAGAVRAMPGTGGDGAAAAG